MNKYLKYSLISLIAMVALIVISGVVISVFFGDEIQKLAIREINRNLTTEVKVNGKINLSIFKNFPDASLTFNKVEIRESLEGSENNLAEAEEISLIFSIWDIIRGKYNIQRIHLADGSINLLIDKNGNVNYNIWKTSESTDDDSAEDFRIRLQKARMKNMNIRYADETLPQRYEVFLNQGTLNGEFSNTRFIMYTDLDMLTKDIYVKGMNYFPNTPLVLAMNLDIDTENELYKFKSGSIILGKDKYKLDGQVHETAKGTDLSIKIEGEDISLQSLITTLPDAYTKSLKNFDSKGILYFSASIEGLVSHTSNPHMEVNFGLENGKITHDAMKHDFKNVNFTGTFSNGKANNALTTSLIIPSFSATLNGKPVKFEFSAINFENPLIDLKATAELDMNILGPAIETENLKPISGKIFFKDIAVKGRLNDMRQRRNFQNIVSAGTLEIEDINLVYLKKNFSDISGSFLLNSNELRMKGFNLLVDGSDFRIDGSITNILTFMANVVQDDAHPVLAMDVDLKSELLDLDRLFTYEYATKSGDTISQANYLEPFTMFSGKLTASVEKLNWDGFDATGVKGMFTLSPAAINIQSLSGRSVDGHVQLTGQLKVVDDQWLVLENTAQLKNINIRNLFTSFENFGQDVLQAEHLKGALDAELEYVLYWDQQLDFVSDKMIMLADLKIEEGELIDFEPLKDLSAYVKLSELKHIKFTELKNEIEIRNSKILIPAMYIRSTAMNMLMSGTHTFDNEIDYQFRINLMDVLSRKLRVNRVRLSDVEETGEGFINIYVSMTGTVDDPVFNTDKRAVKAKLYEDNKELDKGFIDVFKKEFIEEKERKSIDFKVKDEDDLEFLDWGDDTSSTTELNIDATNGFVPHTN